MNQSPSNQNQRPAPAFLCPGSVQAVSRSIHLARLSSAWPVCDQCELRHDTEGLADSTIRLAEQIRDHRVAGIQRSEYGLRGQYINELDRQTASELARVFCFCLHDSGTTAELTEPVAPPRNIPGTAGIRLKSLPAETPAADVSAEKVQLGPVVVGYDGRSSSPDIFVGVLAAVREFGLDVIDIGRCTSASIQEAARFVESCAGAIHVTGSGSLSSWTGLDVADHAGDPVPVVWKDFGIGLQHVSSADADVVLSPARTSSRSETIDSPDHMSASSARMSELLDRMRDAESVASSALDSADGESCSSAFDATEPRYRTSPRSSYLRLILPDRSGRKRWMSRMSRTSGAHKVLDFEPVYRNWLSRWFPEECPLRILVRSDDSLIHERVAWLAERTQMDLLARSVHDSSHLASVALTMTIDEDDRHFVIADRTGRRISPDRLAGLINVAIHSQSSLVTAHADAASGRFWLADTSRRESRHPTEHVRDSLAALGLIARLIHTGRMILPVDTTMTSTC